MMLMFTSMAALETYKIDKLFLNKEMYAKCVTVRSALWPERIIESIFCAKWAGNALRVNAKC